MPSEALVLTLLRNADLARIQTQFPDYPHTNLLRAIQVSVEALDQRSRSRYLALAVLLEDMPVHPVIQQALWSADDLDCLATAEQFVSLTLDPRNASAVPRRSSVASVARASILHS